MGRPIKIIDLAKMLIRMSGQDVPIMITGLRKGEKLNEELFYNEEELVSTNFEKLMVSKNSESYFSPEEIEKMITEFKQAIRSFDRSFIRELIKKYLPEFKGK
jgi:FlaA1/EpsC-like NDP-sugar epimerase